MTISETLRGLKVPTSLHPTDTRRVDLHKALVAIHLSSNPFLSKTDEEWDAYIERVERECA